MTTVEPRVEPTVEPTVESPVGSPVHSNSDDVGEKNNRNGK